MRHLLTIILSFTLIMSPLTVQAVDLPGTDGADQFRDSSAGAVPGDAYFEKGIGSEGGYDFYAKQILTLSVGIIGNNVATSCVQSLMIPSMIGYVAGSVAMIISEIAAAKELAGKHKKAISDLHMDESKMAKEGSSGQLEQLKTAKKQEEDLLDYLEQKRDWMIAINIVFTLATLAAIVEEIYGHTAGAVTCTGPQAVGGCHAAGAGAVAICSATNSDNATCRATGGTGTSYVNTYVSLVHANCQKIDVGTGWMNKAITFAITTAWTWFSQKGNQDGGAISQWGGMSINALTTIIGFFTDALDQIISLAYQYPIPRAITFGLTEVLSAMVLAGLVERVDAAKSNIAKLDKVIADFKLLQDPGGLESTGGVDSGAGGGGLSSTDPEKLKGGKLKPLPTSAPVASKDMPCMSVQTGPKGQKGIVPGDKCDSPYVIPKAQFTGPEYSSLNQNTQLARNFGNAMAAGDRAGAKAAAAGLVAQAANIKKQLAFAKKQLNDKRKKDGLAPIDFDKEIQKKLEQYQGLYNQAAAKANAPQSNFASGGAVLSGSSVEKAISSSDMGKMTASPASAPAADAGLDLDLGAEDSLANAEKTDVSSKNKLEDFETPDSDIAKDPQVSIFIQLSNRYLLNYKRIFEKGPKTENVPKK